jgi:hypothetical protein
MAPFPRVRLGVVRCPRRMLRSRRNTTLEGEQSKCCCKTQEHLAHVRLVAPRIVERRLVAGLDKASWLRCPASCKLRNLSVELFPVYRVSETLTGRGSGCRSSRSEIVTHWSERKTRVPSRTQQATPTHRHGE